VVLSIVFDKLIRFTTKEDEKINKRKRERVWLFSIKENKKNFI